MRRWFWGKLRWYVKFNAARSSYWQHGKFQSLIYMGLLRNEETQFSVEGPWKSFLPLHVLHVSMQKSCRTTIICNHDSTSHRSLTQHTVKELVLGSSHCVNFLWFLFTVMTHTRLFVMWVHKKMRWQTKPFWWYIFSFVMPTLQSSLYAGMLL